MDFAKAQLSKYGWKEGKGLGASETGVKEALKVKLKFDSAGLGHDRAEEFTFHWWDHVYNKVAGNLEIKKDKEGAVVLEQKEEIKISKKKPSVLNKQIVYGNFVKGGTLHGSELVQKNASSASDEDEEEEQNKDLSLKLSDDELFKICEGRTAHKAARHGLKMTAKLSRVEAQEQLYLEKWGCSKTSSPNIKMEITKKEQDSYNEKTAVNDICGNIKNGSQRAEQEYLMELRDSQTPPTGVNIVKKKKKKKEKDFCEKEVKSDKGDFIAEEHSLQEFGSSEAPTVKKQKRKKNKDFGGIKEEIPNSNNSPLVQQNFQDLDFPKPNHSMKNEKKKRKKEQQQKTFDGEVNNFEAGNSKAGLCTLKERVVELEAELEDAQKKLKKKKEILEDKLSVKENFPRKKHKKKYVLTEEGCEAVVKQDLNVGREMSSNLIQGNNYKHEERDDSEKFIVNQIDEEISLKRKKKKVKKSDCTEILGGEKINTDILKKGSKKEQKSNTLDGFHEPNENRTMKIEGKKKKKKTKTFSDITDKEEESKPVYESEEMFFIRSDAREENKKKKHKKKKSEVTEVGHTITESSRNLCVKKKKKDKKRTYEAIS